MSTKRILLIAAAAIMATAIITLIVFAVTYSPNKEYSIEIPDMRAAIKAASSPESDISDAVPLVEVNSENVLRVLKTIECADAYSRIIKATSDIDEAEKTTYISEYVQGDSRAVSVSGTPNERIIISCGYIFKWSSGDETYFRVPADSASEDYMGEYGKVIILDDILSLTESSILSASYEENDNGAVICISYSTDDSAVTYCTVDAGDGTVIEAHVFEGEKETFSMNTEIKYPGLVPTSVFKLPDGSNVLSDF